jgi:glycosyltransferase involved in cell wall biosynthesis
MTRTPMASANDDTFLIIPVYNEAPVIAGVLISAVKHFKNVVCVDDGSTDGSAKVMVGLPVHLVKHPVNLGQGAALQTGIEYALSHDNTRYLVTFDADGQHRIADVQKMVEEIRKGEYDAILGSRFLDQTTRVGWLKRRVLKFATWLGNRMSGTKLTDAHNGLRVLSRRLAEQLEITMPDMTHGTELIILIGRSKMKYKEMPVTIDYTDYSKAKGQSLWNSINILFDLLLQYAFRR